MDTIFRRPLGLALAGGGALASWQTAAIHELESRHGLEFDAVLGFSAGALNGANYFLADMERAVEKWRAMDGGVLAPDLKFSPFSLFSNRRIWDEVQPSRDEAWTKEVARCKLIVVSAHRHRGGFVYAEYNPEGRGGWDSPLTHHLVASCAIPYIFPPMNLSYRGNNATLIDGGVPCRQPMSFAALAGCRDVIVIEMVREDEIRSPAGWLRRIDHAGRTGCRKLMDQGVQSLKALNPAPRVFRLAPSKILDFSMLNFKRRHIEAGLSLGAADAAAFMAAPERFTVGVTS